MSCPLLCVISIHALVKRATFSKSRSATFVVDISIHALVKRATVINDKQGNYESISIHALVKRATFCG